MPHSSPLIATIVAGIGLAFALGTLAHRVRVSPLVGYLLAGVMIGPVTPGFVADQHMANELAEIGIILLMFGVGLHFSLKDLLAVRSIAVPGAIGQMARRHPARHRAGRGRRMVDRRELPVRPRLVGRQHRRAAARDARPPPAGDAARPHRDRLADRRGSRRWCSRWCSRPPSPACWMRASRRARTPPRSPSVRSPPRSASRC